jgi:AmmeMemoRadiSam system protein B
MENMENARVRWLDIVSTVHEGKEVFVVRDPEGITDKALLVSRDVLLLLSLMDGTRSVADIQVEYMKIRGVPMHSDRVTSVIRTMDEHSFLLNERYRSQVTLLRDEYAAQPFRDAYLPGKSYPENASELRSMLGEMMGREWNSDGKRTVKGLLVPHIDYGRGVDVYAPVYRYLPTEENTLFVVFGTCHKLAPRLWNIAFRDLKTPLGMVRSAGDVGKLITRDPVLKDYVDEWPHRNEHSIELQIPLIQFLMGDRTFEVLSVLTGSLHEYMGDGKHLDQGEAKDLVMRLRTILDAHKGPCVFIAAADLAHIGAQFGDTGPLDRAALNESKRKDQELLETVTAVDASSFFKTVKGEDDRRRICGLAPIFFALSMLDSSEGQLVGYQQWTDGASSVSFAGAVFY